MEDIDIAFTLRYFEKMLRDVYEERAAYGRLIGILTEQEGYALTSPKVLAARREAGRRMAQYHFLDKLYGLLLDGMVALDDCLEDESRNSNAG